MELNQKIGEILKKHVEGKKFFDALDYMIRSDADVLRIFMDFLKAEFNTSCFNHSTGIILTGEFGHALFNNYRPQLLELSRDIIFVGGGLREPNKKAELYVDHVSSNNYILLDDSIYSGNTAMNINQALYESNQSTIYQIFVIYDGSKDFDQINIKSLFKYHQ